MKHWSYHIGVGGFFSGLLVLFLFGDVVGIEMIIWTCFCGLAILVGASKG